MILGAPETVESDTRVVLSLHSVETIAWRFLARRDALEEVGEEEGGVAADCALGVAEGAQLAVWILTGCDGGESVERRLVDTVSDRYGVYVYTSTVQSIQVVMETAGCALIVNFATLCTTSIFT
jgi:hypothetical protein